MENYEQVASIPDRLREAMEDAGKSVADLVADTGLHRSSLYRYLSGDVEPKSKAVNLLGRALGVTEMWLWGYDVPKRRSPEQKKNDVIVHAIAKMRTDPDFAEVVSMLAQLPPEEYASIKQILAALVNK